MIQIADGGDLFCENDVEELMESAFPEMSLTDFSTSLRLIAKLNPGVNRANKYREQCITF